MEQNLPNREIIDATQDAVLNAAGSVANVLENTAHEISGHGEAFYLSPEFWVGVSFVVAVVGLAKPVSKALYGMLKKRGESIAERIKDAAEKLGMPLHVGCIHSSDVFYREGGNDYIKELTDIHHCLAVEMESFALFHNAHVLGKNAACLITVSDSFVTSEVTTPEQRQTSFTKMMEIALEAVE